MKNKRKFSRQKNLNNRQLTAMNNKDIDPIMARKIAIHQARREAEAKKKSKELTLEEKYDYLMKKDWDKDLVVNDGKWRATGLRGHQSLWLEKIFKLPYNPENYMVSKTNAKEATKR